MQVYIPKQKETLLPNDYIKLAQEERSNIKTVRFIPPKLGQRGYGSFEVTYKRMMLRPE